jgi:hypothetical protein
MDAHSPNPFRHANNRLLAVLADEPLGAALPFICECDDPVCFGTIRLSAAEFREISLEGGFVAIQGHSVDGTDAP